MNIFENRFFNFCSNSGFLKDDFIAHLKSIGEDGFYQIIDVKNFKVKQLGYFEETQMLIDCLIYSYHFYNDKNFNKLKYKKIIRRFSARQCLSVFKKYKYLESIDFLNNISSIINLEIAMQTTFNKIKTSFYKEKELINFLSNIRDSELYKIEFKNIPGSNFFYSSDYSNNFIVDENLLVFLFKKDILSAMKTPFIDRFIYRKFYLSPSFKESLNEYKKKQLIREKMKTTF